MISEKEAAKRGLIKHPSGFYIDVERYNALPDANEFHKIAPESGVMAIANSMTHGWIVGWSEKATGNILAVVRSTKEPAFKADIFSGKCVNGYLSLTCCGFTNVNQKEHSDVISMTALVSPARLALERHRQRLDGLLK